MKGRDNKENQAESWMRRMREKKKTKHKTIKKEYIKKKDLID